MRRALAITEASYGPEHPLVAISLGNLAALLWTNRPAEAEPLLRRALAIDEAIYGGEHPAVGRDLNNLGQLLRATDRLDEAEPLMRRALAIDEESYGPGHPRVAVELANLAGLLQATGRLDEAEPLLRRAVLSLLASSHRAGHLLPNLRPVFRSYRSLLEAMSLDEDALRRRVVSLGTEAGLGEAEYRRLTEGL